MIVVASSSGASSQGHYCPSKRRKARLLSKTAVRTSNLTTQYADVLVLTQQQDTFTYSAFAKSEVLPCALLKITFMGRVAVQSGRYTGVSEVPAAVPLTDISVPVRKGLRSEFHLILLGKLTSGE
jgi:hypothetical protein